MTTYPLDFPEQFLPETNSELTQLVQPETLLGEDWLELDPRVEWLVDWLKQHRGEKTLLITANAETAKELELHLRLQHGVRSAVFHEQMTLITRDRAAAFFADDEEGAQILICSEIGSEGRNFQFCSYLVLFDLPSNLLISWNSACGIPKTKKLLPNCLKIPKRLSSNYAKVSVRAGIDC